MIEIDFETYSEAGYTYDPARKKWAPVQKSKPGIFGVGAAVYSEHPSTEVVCMAYKMRACDEVRLWVPGMPNPIEIFEAVDRGDQIAAWNSFFEYSIWANVCTRRYGWPALDISKFFDVAAMAAAWCLPRSLDGAARALDSDIKKDPRGKQLIRKFSTPRNPTKNNSATRTRVYEDTEAGAEFFRYCMTDVQAEAGVFASMPPLTPFELEVFKLDQRINARGIPVDTEAVLAAIRTVNHELEKYNAEICVVTGGAVPDVNKLAALKSWCASKGAVFESLDKDAISEALKMPLPADVKRALELRALSGSAAIKKVYAMKRMCSHDGRIRGVFKYHGAGTGRWVASGIQGQNLPKGGPDVYRCAECERWYSTELPHCPWCGGQCWPGVLGEWCVEAASDAIDAMVGRGPSIQTVHPDALSAVSGSLRAMICAPEGREFISSDYNSIEAIGAAALAGEEWRLDVFRSHGKIYEMSASKITGVPFEEFTRHKNETGEHHPHRNKIGKVAELASGYGGWVNGWKAFGAGELIGDDEEIKKCVIQWRNESPAIVRAWAELERAAKLAIRAPGTRFAYRDVSFIVIGNVLYMQLPSGRRIAYHRAGLETVVRYGREHSQIYFYGYNTNRGRGAIGWARLSTHGGRLFENLVQGACRDVLAYAMVNLERAGYLIAAHVHDEPVSEVPEGFGSVDEYEKIMMDLPPWCADWPVRASGGWRGKRFRK